MKAINAESGECLADSLVVAERLLDRMRGLLGKESFSRGEGLLLRHCRAIHTFGMKFPLDLVFLDRNNRVVALRERVPINRFSPLYVTAASVLELPAGTLACLNVKSGDRIIVH